VLLLAAAVAGSVAGGLSAPLLPSLAALLGAIVGGLLPTLAVKLDLRFRVDDPSALSITHLLGAIAGTLGAACGLDDRSAVAREVLASLGVAIGLILMAVVVGGAGAWLIATVLTRAGWLRLDAGVEEEGVDLALHDVNAYPDFQQTMIKSYHLRQ
jgi:ammonia channel protein AmtB